MFIRTKPVAPNDGFGRIYKILIFGAKNWKFGVVSPREPVGSCGPGPTNKFVHGSRGSTSSLKSTAMSNSPMSIYSFTR